MIERNPGVHIGYNVNIQRSMQRARSSAQPRNPRTLDEAEELLIASPIYKYYTSKSYLKIVSHFFTC